MNDTLCTNVLSGLTTGIELTYLTAAALFIVGLKELGSPATARRGNIIAAVGMLLAMVATLLNQSVFNYQMILVAIVIGSIIGAITAQKVAMTDMPQMVGIFNGLGVQPVPSLPLGNLAVIGRRWTHSLRCYLDRHFRGLNWRCHPHRQFLSLCQITRAS